MLTMRNKVTRCSHTGIIIYVQNAPILWYSKRQNMMEADTFGSEMVALQICNEFETMTAAKNLVTCANTNHTGL